MMKKYKLLFLASIIVLPFVFGACKDNDGIGKMPNNTEITLELNRNSVENLTIGDTVVINADYTYLKDKEVVWTCSDENVVALQTLDKMNCSVTALNVGTATVTATYGKLVETCTVTTATNGIYPVLEFINITDTDEVITKLPNDKLDLGAYVNFNGKRYDDMQISYAFDDTSFGTIDQKTGIVTLTDKEGTATITATATWRGIPSELLQKSVKINVKNPTVYEVTADGKPLSVVDLYTVTEFENLPLKNKEVLSINIRENNVQITDYTVELVEHQAGDGSDREVAIWDSASNTILAKTYGTAKLRIAYTSQTGELIERYYSVIVNCPQGKYQTIKYFSTMKGEFPVEDIFSIGEKKIYRATQDGRELTVSDNGTSILDVVSKTFMKMSKETVVVYNDLVSYEIPLETYKMVIEDKEDFLSIFHTEETFNANGKASYTDTVETGYYFLKNDVTVGAWEQRPDGTARGHRNLLFNGIFEGNGKTLTVQPLLGGAFGSLRGTVKNLNVDFDVEKDIGNRETGKARAMFSQDGTGATVEDVNVRVLGKTNVIDKSVSIFGEASGYASLKNVVIDYRDTVSPELEAFVVNSYWGLLFHYGKNSNTQNVYVISSTMKYLTVYPYDPHSATNKYYTVAENETKVTHPTLPQYVQSGVQRFDTWKDFAEVKNDMSGFTSSVWVTTYGIPIWKEIAEEYVLGYVNGVESDEIELNSIRETTTSIVLSCGLQNIPCELEFENGFGTELATIDGDKITPCKNAFGKATVIANYQFNGVPYQKKFALTVYMGEDETDTTEYTPWTGDALIWSTSEKKISLPEEMREHGEVESVYNQTDGIMVYFGDIWMTSTLDNTTNTLIAKELRIKFADGTGYIANLYCVAQAISTATELETLLSANGKISGYYMLDADKITISAWTTVNHRSLTFAGVFDGAGKSLQIAPIDGGLFGTLNGTVKNLHIQYNVPMNYSDTTAGTNSALFSNFINATATVENINIKLSGATGAINETFSMFGYTDYRTTELNGRNLVIDYGDVVSANLTALQGKYSGLLLHHGNSKFKVENVYLISSGLKYLTVRADSSSYYTVASNDTALSALTGTKYTINSVCRYDTWDTFDTSKDLSGFVDTYWDTTNGKPIWKTK